MNFTELNAAVVTITNRPDLVAETSLAVRRATARMHSIDFWPKDIQEVTLSLITPAFLGQIDTTILPFSRFRAMKYLREYNLVHSGRERYMTKVEPDCLVDEYGYEIQSLWYPAGTVINWKVGYAVQAIAGITGLSVGYYQNPDVSPTTFSSWIAQIEPWCIVEDAAARVLKLTGQLDLANSIAQEAVESLMLLRQNYLEGVGR